MRVSAPSSIIRFGAFEVDLQTGELRKQGIKVKLTGQPFDVLVMLLERPGELVTREEFEKRLWSGDTFVDFEHGLNAAVKKLREALGDGADNPHFVETLPRRGYRFICPIQSDAAVQNQKPDKQPLPAPQWKRRLPFAAALILLVAGGLLALNVAGSLDWVKSRLGIVPPPITIDSIDVLPLENLSADKAQEYFSDGMTDELITELGQVSSLRVISRTSVMRYKQTKKPLPEIAKELNVQGIVEGSVSRSENWVRVTANLIEAKTDRHLWSHSYESELRDVLKLQSEVAHDIAQQVQAKLAPQARTRLTRSRPVNHEAYLRGTYMGAGLEQSGIKARLDYFRRAIELDPNYAMAYVELSRTYGLLENNTMIQAQEASRLAKQAASRAVEIDGNLAEGHVALAQVKMSYEWDWAGTEGEIKRALDINPNCVSADRLYSAYLYSVLGKQAESEAEIQKVTDLDPNQPPWSFIFRHWFMRQYDRVIQDSEVWLESSPAAPQPRFFLGCAYSQKGMHERAIAEFQRYLKLEDVVIPGGKSGLAHAYAVAGKTAEARKVLQEILKLSERQYVRPYYVGMVYAGLADEDRAFEWFEKAYEERSSHMVVFKVDPFLDPLRSDPRFQDLLRRMNFPPQEQ
jgi:TolB-like protein/DNA-binding winged helix-turn-helix (wHTH) protein